MLCEPLTTFRHAAPQLSHELNSMSGLKSVLEDGLLLKFSDTVSTPETAS